jgi:hypothetical protein
VQIANPGIVTYAVSNLSPGTWYFSIRDYTSANVESGASVVVSKLGLSRRTTRVPLDWHLQRHVFVRT